MKIRNRIQTVGVAIRQAVKKSGKSCLNGSGTSDWSWAINCSLIRCVPPSLLLLSRLRTRSPPNLPRRLLFRDTDRLLWLYPGKRAASRGKILPSNRMARCAARRIRSFVLMSGAEKATAACVWSMQPAFAVVVIAPCASNVNGMAAPLRNPARLACCCIHWPSVLNPSSGGTGVADTIDGCACNCFVTNAWRSRWSSGTLLPQPSRLCPCRVHSARIIVSTGLSGLLATHESRQQAS